MLPGYLHDLISTESITRLSEDERKQIINAFDAILASKKSPLFRKALRELSATSLETLLYGNSTDPLSSTPFFPDEALIQEKFEKYGEIYHYFQRDNVRKMASQDFLLFFKMCKIYGDFIENNNNEPNDKVAFEHAYKMTVIFGNGPKNKRFEALDNYIKRFVKTEHFIHDTFIRNIPEVNPKNLFNLVKWRQWIIENGQEGMELFQIASDIQEKLQLHPNDFEHAKSIAATLRFTRATENEALNAIAKRHHVREKYFNIALDIDEERKISDHLPNVDTADSTAEYHLLKLPISDPHAYFLGFYSNSCQSVGDNGEQCVRDGQTLKNNGFMVLLQAKNPEKKAAARNADGGINYNEYEIIGQGYCWLGKHGNLTIDSWENKFPSSHDAVAGSILKDWAKSVTDNPASGIVRVSIGEGGQTPKKIFSTTLSNPEIMLEGQQYGDSYSQAAVYTNESKKLQIQDDLSKIVKQLEDSGFFHDLDPIFKKFFLEDTLSDSYFYLDFFKKLVANPQQLSELKKLFISLQKQGLDDNYLKKMPLHWDVIEAFYSKNLFADCSKILNNLLPLAPNDSQTNYLLRKNTDALLFLAERKLLDIKIKNPYRTDFRLYDPYELRPILNLYHNGLLNKQSYNILADHIMDTRMSVAFLGQKAEAYISLKSDEELNLSDEWINTVLSYTYAPQKLLDAIQIIQQANDKPLLDHFLEQIEKNPTRSDDIIKGINLLKNNRLVSKIHLELVISHACYRWPNDSEDASSDFIDYKLHNRGNPVLGIQTALGLNQLNTHQLLKDYFPLIKDLEAKYFFPVCQVLVALKNASMLNKSTEKLLINHMADIIPALPFIKLLLKDGKVDESLLERVLTQARAMDDCFGLQITYKLLPTRNFVNLLSLPTSSLMTIDQSMGFVYCEIKADLTVLTQLPASKLLKWCEKIESYRNNDKPQEAIIFINKKLNKANKPGFFAEKETQSEFIELNEAKSKRNITG